MKAADQPAFPAPGCTTPGPTRRDAAALAVAAALAPLFVSTGTRDWAAVVAGLAYDLADALARRSQEGHADVC